MRRTLAGGLQLRSAGPHDAELISEFICRLSPASQYLRFFGAVAPPSSGLVRALCRANPRGDVLVVTDVTGDVIAHGMAVDGGPGRDPATSEIALIVADSWQNRGLGTSLLRILTDRGAERGVRTLLMEVLPDNQRMLGIIRRRWPAATLERTTDSVILRAAISQGGMNAGERAAA